MRNGSARKIGRGPIVACGHLCIDIIPSFPRTEAPVDYFRPGRLVNVGAPVIATGGSVSNVGISLHRLGVAVRLVARIGEDPLGRLIMERVESQGRGLAQGIRAVAGETSSYSVVVNPPGIDRIFYHCPGANDSFAESDVDDDVLAGASIFHFGYPPLMRRIHADGGEGLARLFARARKRGAMTSLDMSLPDPANESGRVDWRAFLDRVLPEVDLFLPSIEELAFMDDRELFDAAFARGDAAAGRGVSFARCASLAEQSLARGVCAVMLKLGDRGAYLRTGPHGVADLAGWKGRELYTPVFRVERIGGTTGSGDATIAGFLASVANRLAAEEALTMAVAVGACCVEQPDATSGVRGWAETVARVKSGWARTAASVPEGGWRRAADLWRGPNDRGP